MAQTAGLPEQPESTAKRHRWLIIIAAALTIAFSAAIAFDLAPWLRGPGEWRWVYAIPGTFKRLWLPTVLLVVYILAAQWVIHNPSTHNQAVIAITLSTIMVPAIQLALLYMDHPDPRSQLFYRTVSEGANGFFNVGAVIIDRDDFLRYYAQRMLSWYSTHPQRHPPGLPVLFSLARQFFDAYPELMARLNPLYRSYQCHNISLMNLPDCAIASATIQMILPFLSSLIVWPLYRFGQQVYDRATAIRAVLLWPLLPGLALWSGYWNPFYAFFTVLAFLFFHYGLSKHNLFWFYLSGLVVSVALFLTFANAAIPGLLGIYALVWLSANKRAGQLETRTRPRFIWLVAGTTVFILGAATLWIYLWFRHGLSFFAVWHEAMSKHFEMDRVGWFWIVYHLYDFFVNAMSIPILILWAANSFRALMEMWAGAYVPFTRARALNGPGESARKPDVLAVAFLIGLAVIDLSGTSRGEVARVWAFMIPLPLLIALCRLPRRRALFTTMIILLGLQLLVCNVFIRYIGTDLTDPPLLPPQAAQAPAGENDTINWENGIVLQSSHISTDRDQITVQADWTTTQPVNRPYTIFVHLYDEAGNLIAQRDTMPLQGAWPTTCWRPGQTFRDSYTLTIPGTADRTRPQTLKLGLYWLPTGERLSLLGQDKDTIQIGTVTSE